MRLIATIFVVAFSGAAVGQDFGGHALFIRTADANAGKKKKNKARSCERTLFESTFNAFGKIGEKETIVGDNYKI